jgi:hypothetical protein
MLTAKQRHKPLLIGTGSFAAATFDERDLSLV